MRLGLGLYSSIRACAVRLHAFAPLVQRTYVIAGASKMSGGADDVRAFVRQLLPQADLNTVTERSIRAQVAERFGDGDYKNLVKEEVERFLTAGQASGGAPSSPSAAGNKRKGTPGDDDSGRAKVARGDEPPLPGQPGRCWQLGPYDKVYCTVDTFKGRVLVQLRQYYEKDGQLAPGRQGLALSAADWATLAAELPAVAAAAEGRQEGYLLQLSQNKRVTMGQYQGHWLVQVRETWTTPEGEVAPSKKGIALREGQLAVLMEVAADISAAAAAAGGAPLPAPAAVAAAPAPPSSSKAPAAAAAPGSAGPSATSSQAGGNGSAGGAEEGFIDLGANRRAHINMFQGRTLVDLREYYQKDGTLAPGAKGIALSPADWATLMAAAPDISAAVAAGNKAFALPLSGKRQATISDFRGRLYVDVREYYDKGGQLAPGKKGLSMTPEQWGRLVEQRSVMDKQLCS